MHPGINCKNNASGPLSGGAKRNAYSANAAHDSAHPKRRAVALGMRGVSLAEDYPKQTPSAGKTEGAICKR